MFSRSFPGLLALGLTSTCGPESLAPASAAGAPIAASTASNLFVAPGGSDLNAGTSAQAPLRTIAEAAGRAAPGTTVLIAAGTYREQVVTRTGGTAGKPIVLKSAGGTAVIDGSQLPWLRGKNQNQGLIELRHPWIRLEGLTVANSPNSGIVLAADHLTVDSCEVRSVFRHAISTDTNFQTAVRGRVLRDVVIRNNRIHRAILGGKGYGQAISLIADGFEVRGNTLSDNNQISIDIWLGASHGEVADNIVRGNPGQDGIYVDGASYVRIHGNQVSGNRNGIGVSSEDGRYPTRQIWIYNNLVYNNTGDGCFIWDPDVGATDVVFGHNTVVGNSNSFRIDGRRNTARIVNNLSWPRRRHLANVSRDSDVSEAGNVWLEDLAGFVQAANGDFRLAERSPAIGRGVKLPDLVDDLGQKADLGVDKAGRPRTADGRPDAGAFMR